VNLSRVICLGELLFDYLAAKPGESLSAVTDWHPYPGGAPANVACGLVKLGTSCAFIGCLGSDLEGTQLLEFLSGEGVDTSSIQRHPVATTPKVYVLRSLSGDRSFAGFGEYSPAEFSHAYLESSLLNPVLFEQAEFLVLGSLCYAYSQSAIAMDEALNLATQNQLNIFLDVNWRPMFWSDPDQAPDIIRQLLTKIDFLKLSAEEALWLFDTTDAEQIFCQISGLKGVIVTAGAAKVNYCFGEITGEVTPFCVNPVDTTGAGDGFLAGFIHQLCQQGIEALKDPETARKIIIYACAVGGITTLSEGAIGGQPTASQVQTFLENPTISNS